MSDRPSITVIVMAYNEEATLVPTCEEILGVLARAGVSWELLIVDDGSSDATKELALDLAARGGGIRTIRHEPNRGLGGVYRTGFSEARGQLLTFFPADGQFPAAIIEDFLPRIEQRDLVLGYLERRATGLGKILSLVERVLYAMLFGRMPRFQGIMLIRRELLESVPLQSSGRGWAVVMEFILKAHRRGARIVNAPTPIRDRTHGVSKVNNMRTIIANFRQLLTLRRHLREIGQV